MNKPDGRLLPPTVRNYLRQQGIRLREQGKRFIDMQRTLVFIATQFRNGGKSISEKAAVPNSKCSK
jgi:hypothetical protein